MMSSILHYTLGDKICLCLVLSSEFRFLLYELQLIEKTNEIFRKSVWEGSGRCLILPELYVSCSCHVWCVLDLPYKENASTLERVEPQTGQLQASTIVF